MTVHDWRTVTELFHEARQREAGEQEAWLLAACGSDSALLERVRRLLAAYQAAPDFLQTPLAEDALRLIADADPEATAVGSRIGPYQLVHEIGRGGMGAVYLAERADAEFHKQVAIKVIKRGMDTDGVLRRFRDERQILAELEHPNVARLLDGGTSDDGRPYFVMEYVDGERIDQYCDHRRLTIEERLRLFLQVCAAVSYAHQRLVVHRDIKPSNVLVTADGTPKLVDFGIAKLMRPDAGETLDTVASVRPMTPEYASPEQVQSLRVDALSDVYSLGVLLYELLAGAPPFTFTTRTPEDIAHVVLTRDPARPSTRVVSDRQRRQLQGDLDTITLKALARVRARRYQSVEQFADDIARHLDGRPILARKDAALYRARKFVGRNKLPVMAAAAVFLTLVTGITATSRQAIRANRAEREALAERDRASSAQRTATSERDRATEAERLATADRDRAREAEAVATAARAQAEKDRNRAVDESKRADAESAAARAVTEFLQNDVLAQAAARTQSTPGSTPDPNLTVRSALDRAAARISGRFSAQPSIEGAIEHTIGTAYQDLGLFAQAQQHLERATDLRRQSLGPTARETLASMSTLAFVLHLQGKNADAEARLRTVLAVEERLFGRDSAEVAETLNNLATTVSALGRRSDADALHARVLEIERRLHGEEHPDTLVAMNNLVAEYSNEGKYAEADALGQRVVAIKRRVLGDDQPSTLNSMATLGVVYRNEGKYAEAESILSETLERRRRITGDDTPDTFAAMNSLANVYSAERKYTEAESLLTRVIDGRRKLYGEENPDTLQAMNNLAELYRREGKASAAEAAFNRVLAARTRILGATHPNTLAVALSLGALKLDTSGAADAEPFLKQAADGYVVAAPDSWQRYYAQSLLARSLGLRARYGEAEPLLLAGYEGMTRRRSSISAENRPKLDEVKQFIVEFYQRWGRPEQVRAWQDDSR